MRTADFHFHLPPELIAQVPLQERDQSRLLVLDRTQARLSHRHFSDLPDFLRAEDLLVLNNSRVIPARMRGVKPGSGGQIEILLCEENARNDWWVMLRPGKRVRPGTKLLFRSQTEASPEIEATVLEKNAEGHCRLQFSWPDNILEVLEKVGEVPLPPYIDRVPQSAGVNDLQRYQTVFAQPPGSVAAPTAGLHFTESLLSKIRSNGIQTAFVTLHVGLGTFAPIKVERIEDHVMHQERFTLPAATVEAIQRAKAAGGRVFAVGTTAVRVLESAAGMQNGALHEISGKTNIFIYPPYSFRVVDALITNFHLPESTLLMLVSAFAARGTQDGRERILAAYAEAVRERYRFFSYGDAMLIL